MNVCYNQSCWVLPNQAAGTQEIARFLAGEISPNTYLNAMGQYRPAWQASRCLELDRPVTRDEHRAAVQAALDAGLQRLDSRRPFAW